LQAVAAVQPQLTAFAGKLGSSAQNLLDYLTLMEQINSRVKRVAHYSSRMADVDTRNPKYQDMRGRFMSVAVGLGAACSFETPEIMALDETKLEQFYQECPGLERYRRYLTDMRRRKDHILSGTEEHLLASAGEMAQTPTSIYGSFMNADMKLSHIVAGDRFQSWEKACALADAIYTVPISEKADVVITGCGGFPKDMSFYQGSKAIDNVQPALKDGGTLILIAECRDGGGPAEYFDWLKPLKAGTLDAELRSGFTIPGYVFYLNCEQAKKFRIMMISKLNKQDALEMGIEVYEDIDQLLSDACLDNKSVLIIPNGSVVIPKVQ
jgi:hypothetical protein